MAEEDPTQPGWVGDIVERMAESGHEPALLVFLSPEGTTTLFVRDGIELSDFLRFLAEWDREQWH